MPLPGPQKPAHASLPPTPQKSLSGLANGFFARGNRRSAAAMPANRPQKPAGALAALRLGSRGRLAAARQRLRLWLGLWLGGQSSNVRASSALAVAAGSAGRSLYAVRIK